MFCYKCGKKIEAGKDTCPVCGANYKDYEYCSGFTGLIEQAALATAAPSASSPAVPVAPTPVSEPARVEASSPKVVTVKENKPLFIITTIILAIACLALVFGMLANISSKNEKISKLQSENKKLEEKLDEKSEEKSDEKSEEKSEEKSVNENARERLDKFHDDLKTIGSNKNKDS